MSRALAVAMELLAHRYPDVLVVAAAGNDGDTRPCWPAAFPEVVAVAGLRPDLSASDWSNRGGWVSCSAVGEGVVSTYVEGHKRSPDTGITTRFGPDPWACWTGTSFAAPQIAGAVARISAASGCTPRQALSTVLAGARAIPGFGAAVRLLPGT